ncbi:helix-turn-helix transcriptional regulator [Sphingobacterium bambusae]|uniref:Helix-turn-helix transcriptional regulator n=1 Tax=Sphingobacterium bambusae TaxID=662858 RepID=A0ABW6BDK3_9SPHI|nr:hypothetical protein [Sphingobacterium bambusae]WPL48762.1 hypothetical protein SCB77_22690 [Sphingobacterium bambusae]
MCICRISFKIAFFCLLLCGSIGFSTAQDIDVSTQQVLEKVEELQLQNKRKEVIHVLDTAIKSIPRHADLAYLYAYKSSWYSATDSLVLGKRFADQSMEYASLSGNKAAKAAAYRAKAYLNNMLGLTDAVVSDALKGLQFIDGDSQDLTTKYALNYLLYGAYSKWGDSQKMQKYIQAFQRYALEAKNINLQANVQNGLSSMYQARYHKTKDKNLIDSSLLCLNKAFELHWQHPEKVSGNTFVISCINLANYYLEFAAVPEAVRQEKAFQYLRFAEDKLRNGHASAEKWISVFGIKSGFAKREGKLDLAEQYLQQGLSLLMSNEGSHYKVAYAVNKELAAITLQRNEPALAITYQQRAEELLKKSFDEQQLLNAQKLEIQFETEKKDQQLRLLKEREEFRKKQNYLYGGIAVALTFGLVFMFVSYHFRLRYAIERERKMQKQKEDAEQQALLQLKLEQEEQARLKAEQELLEIRQQQLEKEALANNLLIERKNDTLKQIQEKIQHGESAYAQKLIKEEMLMQADFEVIKMQIQELHPEFFKRLAALAKQKLTPLDLRYCTYLSLNMTTKQMAQALHVEPQSVRMFKYRLKQKFGLGKDSDLEDLLTKL